MVHIKPTTHTWILLSPYVHQTLRSEAALSIKCAYDHSMGGGRGYCQHKNRIFLQSNNLMSVLHLKFLLCVFSSVAYMYIPILVTLSCCVQA